MYCLTIMVRILRKILLVLYTICSFAHEEPQGRGSFLFVSEKVCKIQEYVEEKFCNYQFFPTCSPPSRDSQLAKINNLL